MWSSSKCVLKSMASYVCDCFLARLSLRPTFNNFLCLNNKWFTPVNVTAENKLEKNLPNSEFQIKHFLLICTNSFDNSRCSHKCSIRSPSNRHFTMASDNHRPGDHMPSADLPLHKI